MKRSRFTEEQIIGILREGEAGRPVRELCRTHGISAQTFHRWKSKYGGLEVSEARRLKQLEEENRRLKKLVADLSLDNAEAWAQGIRTRRAARSRAAACTRSSWNG